MKLVTALIPVLLYASIAAGQTPAPTCKPPRASGWFQDELKGPVKVSRTYETWFLVSKRTGRAERQPRRLESEMKFGPDEPGSGVGFGTSNDDTSVRYVCGENGKPIEEIVTTRVHPEHFSPKRYDVYITTKGTFKYDARGNKIEEKRFRQDGSLYTSWFFNYDSNNRLIKETRMDKLGRLEDQSFYEYGADGQPLTQTHFNNSCFTQRGDFCKGNISSGDGFFHYASRTKYKYDSHGNWIRQTEWYMDGEAEKPKWMLSKITEREITYYPDNKQ